MVQLSWRLQRVDLCLSSLSQALSCESYPRGSPQAPNSTSSSQGVHWTLAGFPCPALRTAENFPNCKPVQSQGSSHLSAISQRSLSIAWCPAFCKLLFYLPCPSSGSFRWQEKSSPCYSISARSKAPHFYSLYTFILCECLRYACVIF